MTFIILDLDNTVANDAWRIPKIDWAEDDPFKRYHRYHQLSSFDEAGNRDLFDGTPHDVIIMTARPVHYHAQTEEWLLRQGIDPAIIMMRNNGDHTHSRELKRRQFLSLWEAHNIAVENIACAYDDREDVVDMYRNFGVNAEVRSIHNICAYTNPYGEKR